MKKETGDRMPMPMDGTRPRSKPTAGAPSELLYLYCIVERGTKAHTLLQQRTLPGIEPDEPLFPIEASGLVAAVSRVSSSTLREETLNDLLTDLPSLAPFAIKHEEAVRALLNNAPSLIPISLGALYRDADRVKELLSSRDKEFKKLLATLNNKQEWGLKIFKDDSLLQKSVGSSSPRLRKIIEEEAASSPGKAYLLQRQRERIMQDETSQFLARRIEDIAQTLSPVVADTFIDALPEDQQGALPLAWKAAFLVPTEDAQAFQGMVGQQERINKKLGLSFELSGPWAPYSFVKNREGSSLKLTAVKQNDH